MVWSFLAGVLLTLVVLLLLTSYGYTVWCWWGDLFRSTKELDFLEKYFKDDL